MLAHILNKSDFNNMGIFSDRSLKYDPSLVVPQLRHSVVQAHKFTVSTYFLLPEADLLTASVDVSSPTRDM